jgi:hypothetical protein
MGIWGRAVLTATAGISWTAGAALAQGAVPTGTAHSLAYREEIRIAVSDSGDHFVTDQQTTWRIQAPDTLVLLVDSTLRVVRVAINGKRSSWGRKGMEVVIPQPGSPGDTLITRVRFHGAPNGHNWFAVPRDTPDSAPLLLAVEVPSGTEPVTDGMSTAVLEGVDSLAYGRTSWRFRFTQSVALSRLQLEMTRPGSR